MKKKKDYLLTPLMDCKVDGVLHGGRAMCGMIGIGNYKGKCTSTKECQYQCNKKK